MNQKRPKKTDPPAPLVYHGFSLCDQCAGPLAQSERLAGICARCLAPETSSGVKLTSVGKHNECNRD